LPDADLETLRELDRRQDLLEVSRGRRQRLPGFGAALLLLGVVAEEPVVWRLGPEFFLVRIV
jgi:hypothetical protein